MQSVARVARLLAGLPKRAHPKPARPRLLPIKSNLLGPSACIVAGKSPMPRPPPRTRGKAPVRDHILLSQLMALLGQSRLSSNVNQLAKAANSGSLPVTPETESDLRHACRDIAEIRRMLMQALGLDAGDAR